MGNWDNWAGFARGAVGGREDLTPVILRKGMGLPSYCIEDFIFLFR